MTTIRPAVVVKPLTESDRPWANQLLRDEWGGVLMVTRGAAHDLGLLPGFVAWHGSQRAGLLIYRLAGDACEIMSLNSTVERIGAGSALLAAVEVAAKAVGCRRVWLITTNDNLHALGFYQRRGYVLVALYPNSLEAARQIKPQIPLVGLDGIPLRDELELERWL